MPEHFIMSLDEGTSSTRAIIFDTHGAIRGIAQEEFTQLFPAPGLVEHNADEIWEKQCKVMQGAISDAGIVPSNIDAVGITNQRETVVLWDRLTGQPIYNALVWQDRRTTELCKNLQAEGLEDMVHERTGLLLDPYFSGTKLKWLLDHIPGARTRAAKGELAAGTIDSWLAYKLTGGRAHVTDVSNACRTLLYDIRENDWNDELLKMLDIPREVLPEVVSSSAVIGECDANIVGHSIPVAGLIGDQQAALFGQLCTHEGMVKNTYGTGCFMLMNTGENLVRSEHRLLTTVAWKLGDQPVHYALEGAVFIAGAAIQWLRDGLGIIRTAPEINALAESVPDSGGCRVVPAFAGLGAPYWDPTARGIIGGITRGTTKAHIARATLESLAFQTADLLHAMAKDCGRSLSMLRVDGGAAASNLLLQMQADLLDIPIERPQTLESTALGAAYMAGLAVGTWPDVSALESHRKVDQVFEPSMDATTRAKLQSSWKLAVERALHWTSS
ncbi:MAG: glycerol kinase GlpK [Planctomycetota bacterium]|nr:glycerol kinase GlpK [Planctomycetota bacterium]